MSDPDVLVGAFEEMVNAGVPVDFILDALAADYLEERIASYRSGHDPLPAVYNWDPDRVREWAE